MKTEQSKFEIGQTVRIKALKIEGTVTAFLRDSEGFQMKVVYWWEGNRKAEWLFEFEIEHV